MLPGDYYGALEVDPRGGQRFLGLSHGQLGANQG